MKMLILKKTASHYGGEWSDNDYVVLDGAPVAGRILLHPQAPQRQPWFWTITAREAQPSVFNKCYSGSRESAMQDFKTRWQFNAVPKS